MHSVQAEYLPAPGFASSSDTGTLTVGRAETRTLVRIVPGNGIAGQDLDVDAVVTPTTAALGAPSGSVSVVIDGTPVATDTLEADGVARGSTSFGTGSHTVNVTYQGDTNYVGSGGSATVTVAPAGSMIVLTASPNPAALDQLVTFNVAVDSIAPSLWWPSGVLTSTIDGAAVPGSVTLDGNGDGASFARAFSTPGQHLATVHFTGDQDFLPADTSAAVTVTGPSYDDPFPTTVSRRSLAARGLTLKATPKRDRRAPYAFTVTGTVQLPASVAKADGCSGKVTVEAKVKAKRVARTSATVTRACSFKAKLTSARKGSVTISAAFGGNASVSGVDARPLKVKAG